MEVKHMKAPETMNEERTLGTGTSALGRDSTSRTTSDSENKRRRCVSTACIACRHRKSKCDGNAPACAACTSVYHTRCVYDPSSDHRRKGVYKKDIDGLKTRNSTLQTLVQAILSYDEEDVPDLIARIRAHENLDKIAESINLKDDVSTNTQEDGETSPSLASPINEHHAWFESQLSSKMSELRLDKGSMRVIGGTSNLLFLEESLESDIQDVGGTDPVGSDPATTWTRVTSDATLIRHLLNYYFCWHFEFFTILPRAAFERDFGRGFQEVSNSRQTQYCSPILVNAMLALGCHFTSCPGARAHPDDSSTAGDHFFQEAKRLIYDEDLLAAPRLSTVQALALMSVREAGCGREARGWVYSGMAFRMACDLGLSFNSTPYTNGTLHRAQDDDEEDARRITFWGCFMIDKCWSQYLGRLPLFQRSSNVTVPKFEVFPAEDASNWCPYSESGYSQAHAQPSRIRAVALQTSALCDISSDLIGYFYHPENFERPLGRQVELKRLQEIHGRLETWKRALPKEFEPKEGTLPSVIVLHMFFQVLYIHLFRPFLKYTEATSPLPNNISPRKLCTQAATTISKLLRLYKRSHGLRQIVNLSVYITHSACTIHLLNLPEKAARRDITHGVKALEEIAEGWLCARRTLSVLSAQARKWQIELPEDAATVLARTDSRFGRLGIPASTSPVVHTAKQAPTSAQLPTGNRQPQPHQKDQPSEKNHAATIGPVSNVYVIPEFPGAGDGIVIGSRQTFPADSAALHESRSTARGAQDNGTLSALPVAPSIIPNQRPVGIAHQQPDSQPSRKRRLPSAADANSMFGGVEALLREGQDWWMKDQSALALDFANWNYTDSRNDGVTRPRPHAQQAAPQPLTGRTPQTQQTGSHSMTSVESQPARDMAMTRDHGNEVMNNDFTIPATGFAQPDLTFGYGLYSKTYDENDWYR